jgi:hypothetical protein
MLSVNEGIFESQEVVIVVLVQLGVELCSVSIPNGSKQWAGTSATDQIQNRHLHHALVEVCCAVLDDLDGDNFLGFHVLAFHDLAERALAENIQDQISVPEQK